MSWLTITKQHRYEEIRLPISSLKLLRGALTTVEDLLILKSLSDISCLKEFIFETNSPPLQHRDDCCIILTP
jgi:hypothetical protein